MVDWEQWFSKRYREDNRKQSVAGLLPMVSHSTARDLPADNSSINPIRVDYIETSRTGTAGQIGMTLCPGRKDIGMSANYNRSLKADFVTLRDKWKVNCIVNLIEKHEFERLKIQNYFDLADDAGFATYWYPIVDGGVPRSIRHTRIVLDEVVSWLRYGQNVLFHCKAGRGRTGTMVAGTLVRLGYDPDDAIKLTRLVRKGAVENSNQEAYVHRIRNPRSVWREKEWETE
jgi:ADP-ribosyl-[dinitrogen reductase] hydrolase